MKKNGFLNNLRKWWTGEEKIEDTVQILFQIREWAEKEAMKGNKRGAERWANIFNEMVREMRKDKKDEKRKKPTPFPVREIAEPRLWEIHRERVKRVIKLHPILSSLLSFIFRRQIMEIRLWLPGFPATRITYTITDSQHSCDFCGSEPSFLTSLFCFYPPNSNRISKVECCGERGCKRAFQRLFARLVNDQSYQQRISEALLIGFKG